MAHHQGMTIVAIANVLLDGRMRRRFHSEPIIQATELLLQERAPRDVSAVHPRAEEVKAAAPLMDARLPRFADCTAHTIRAANASALEWRYSVMLTSAGSGYSAGATSGDALAEDATRDDSGSYIYLRDVASGAVWSAAYQPCGVEPDAYQVTFTEDRAEIIRTDATITTILEIVVSPEDDVEVRHLSITNTGHQSRRSRSHRIRSWCSPLPPPMRRIRRFSSSSCKRSMRPSSTRCWRRAASAARKTPTLGGPDNAWRSHRIPSSIRIRAAFLGRPNVGVFRAALAARRQQRVELGRILRLHEELEKRLMRRIGGGSGEHQLRIRCDLDLPL